MAYAVETPVFEGPFDLLLHLIFREQVDLYEVRLCDIVDAYLEHLEHLEGLDLDVATEFLLIAATLVELKSKRLLPDEGDIDLDDEFSVWEERDLLLSRLVECKTFKDAAVALATLANKAGRSWPRVVGVDDRYVGLLPDLLEGTSPAALRAAFVKATTPKPVPRVQVDHIHQIRVTVTDAVAELLDELPAIGRISFVDLTGEFVERLEVVVRFLAVLELYKQGWIDLEQPNTVSELIVVWTGRGDDADGWRTDDLDLIDAYDG